MDCVELALRFNVESRVAECQNVEQQNVDRQIVGMSNLHTYININNLTLRPCIALAIPMNHGQFDFSTSSNIDKCKVSVFCRPTVGENGHFVGRHFGSRQFNDKIR
jgi:hypothetical protein